MESDEIHVFERLDFRATGPTIRNTIKYNDTVWLYNAIPYDEGAKPHHN